MAIPVLVFDYNVTRDLAENIWHGQMASGIDVLTYSGPDIRNVRPDQKPRKDVRNDAMHYDDGTVVGEIPRILSRDEYPFACSFEGGGKSFVGHIPTGQNSTQGGMIAAFLKANNIAPGDKFEVRVINYPRGQVKDVRRKLQVLKLRGEVQALENRINTSKGLHESLIKGSTASPLQIAAFAASAINPVTLGAALINPANRSLIGAAVNKLNPATRPELSIWDPALAHVKAGYEAATRNDPVGVAAALGKGDGRHRNASAQFQAWRDGIGLAGKRAELAIGVAALAAMLVAAGIFALEAAPVATAATGTSTGTAAGSQGGQEVLQALRQRLADIARASSETEMVQAEEAFQRTLEENVERAIAR